MTGVLRHRLKRFTLFCVCFSMLFLTACGNQTKTESEETEQMIKQIQVQVGAYNFTATLEDNQAAKELAAMLQDGSMELYLEDYAGFEKVGSLGKRLTRSDEQTTTECGDIVLYNGSSIVMFYGSNSWSYTRLGRIDNLTDWEKALGAGEVTVVLSAAE